MRQAGVDAPGDAARRLLEQACGVDRGGLIARGDVALAPSARARLDRLVAAQAAGAAPTRIAGRGSFWSFDCPTTPQTLDPRDDSEAIVAAARGAALADRPIRVLDLGCGTGCLLAALLLARPHAEGVAADVSADAARYAAALLRALGLAGRTAVVVADAADWRMGGFDLAVANPPYLTTAEMAAAPPAVRNGDPPGALDGGADGCAAHRVFAGALMRALRPGAPAFVEIGAEQAAAAGAVYRAAGFAQNATLYDLAGRPRGLALQRPPDHEA